MMKLDRQPPIRAAALGASLAFFLPALAFGQAAEILDAPVDPSATIGAATTLFAVSPLGFAIDSSLQTFPERDADIPADRGSMPLNAEPQGSAIIPVPMRNAVNEIRRPAVAPTAHASQNVPSFHFGDGPAPSIFLGKFPATRGLLENSGGIHEPTVISPSLDDAVATLEEEFDGSKTGLTPRFVPAPATKTSNIGNQLRRDGPAHDAQGLFPTEPAPRQTAPAEATGMHKLFTLSGVPVYASSIYIRKTFTSIALWTLLIWAFPVTGLPAWGAFNVLLMPAAGIFLIFINFSPANYIRMLVHEFGHAMIHKFHGNQSYIVLSPDQGAAYPQTHRLLNFAAGPLAGIIFGVFVLPAAAFLAYQSGAFFISLALTAAAFPCFLLDYRYLTGGGSKNGDGYFIVRRLGFFGFLLPLVGGIILIGLALLVSAALGPMPGLSAFAGALRLAHWDLAAQILSRWLLCRGLLLAGVIVPMLNYLAMLRRSLARS